MIEALLLASPFLSFAGGKNPPAAGGAAGEGAEILPYRPPHQRSETTAKLGMIIFLGSWAMMFGALFFAYGVIRNRAAFWPPPDLPRLPLSVGIVNTLVLLVSSGSLHASLVAIARNAQRAATLLLAATAGLGATFLGLQLRGWGAMQAQGFTPQSGAYASVFFGLTWLHAAHVVVGVLALIGLVVRAWQGAYSAPRHLPMRLWAMYWHFVGVVWALMFVLIYLV